MLIPLFCRTVVIYPLSGVAPSAQMTVDCHEQAKVMIMTHISPYVEQIGQDPGTLSFLSEKVNCLFWAGGDTSSATEDAIAAKMRHFTTCGSTEMGM